MRLTPSLCWRPIRRLKKMIGTSPPPKKPPPPPGRPACPGPAPAPEERAAPEVEDAAAFEEEVALLGEEEAEAREVDLLLVDLDLREVGVVGEVRGQVLGDAVLDVDADVAGGVVADAARDVAGQPADRVGLHLERPVARRHLQARQSGRGRHPELAGSAGDRDRIQVGPLVLPADVPAELQPPELLEAGAEADRLEGDLHLDRPTPVEAADAGIPDRVPVDVRIPLVGELEVDEAAQGVDHEREGVPPVVERVERRDEVLVLDRLERVAPHLVGDPARIGRGVPQARRDVHAVVVVEDPRVGPLGRRCALDRHLLHETAERRSGLVHAFVEHAVDAQRLLEPHRAQGGAAAGVAVDGRGWNGRRGSTDDGPRSGAEAGPGAPFGGHRQLWGRGHRRRRAGRFGPRRRGGHGDGCFGGSLSHRGSRLHGPRLGGYRKPLVPRSRFRESRLQIGGEAVLQVEQVRHRAVDDRRPYDRARRHLDDAGRDPQLSRLPLVTADDDPAGAQRASGGDHVGGRGRLPAQDRQARTLERRRQRLDDADAVPGVHGQAGDVRERKHGDAAGGLGLRGLRSRGRCQGPLSRLSGRPDLRGPERGREHQRRCCGGDPDRRHLVSPCFPAARAPRSDRPPPIPDAQLFHTVPTWWTSSRQGPRRWPGTIRGRCGLRIGSAGTACGRARLLPSSGMPAPEGVRKHDGARPGEGGASVSACHGTPTTDHGQSNFARVRGSDPQAAAGAGVAESGRTMAEAKAHPTFARRRARRASTGGRRGIPTTWSPTSRPAPATYGLAADLLDPTAAPPKRDGRATPKLAIRGSTSVSGLTAASTPGAVGQRGIPVVEHDRRMRPDVFPRDLPVADTEITPGTTSVV